MCTGILLLPSITLLDSIPNNIFTYTDNKPLITKKPLLYRIGISNPGGCTPAIKGINYNASKSNTGNISFVPNTASVQSIDAPINGIEVYPNPSSGVFTVSMTLSNNTQDVKLTVINALGQEMQTQSFSNVAEHSQSNSNFLN